jgi:hypothetical protein
VSPQRLVYHNSGSPDLWTGIAGKRVQRGFALQLRNMALHCLMAATAN